MVSLQDIFDDLSYGPATNLAIGKAGFNGMISANDYPRIVNLVNKALVELSSRFQLRIKEVDVYQIADQTDYRISTDHAGTADECGSDDIYVKHPSDDEDFEDDIVKILHVYHSDGTSFSLNDTNAYESETYPPMYTPEYNLLQMTPADPVEVVTVEYQAHLPKIKIGEGFNPVNVTVQIPRNFIALVNIYVVHLLLSGMNTRVAEGEQQPQSTWMNRFELACRAIQNNGLIPERNEMQHHFEDNGFV